MIELLRMYGCKSPEDLVVLDPELSGKVEIITTGRVIKELPK